MSHPPQNTAILLIDPYNDYIHPSGKVYSPCEASLEATDTITHMKALVVAARAHHIPIFYCMHQPWRTGNFDRWNRIGPFHGCSGRSGSVRRGAGGRTFMRACSRI